MAILDSMKKAWNDHPYIIIGAGVVIVAYFLWPSSSSSTSTTAANTSDPYGEQLSAETALSQTQLAEQAATDQNQSNNTAAEYAAAESGTATSNEAVAQANAAAIVSYNQTAQDALNATASLGIAQAQANSTDFTSLISGLTAFGEQASGGATTASANGLDAFLTSIGATFSASSGPDGVTGGGGTNTSQSSSSAAAVAGGGAFGVAFSSSNAESGVHLGPSPDAESYLQTATAANTPFELSDNLLGGLWGQAIQSYNEGVSVQGATAAALAKVQPITSPVLAGSVQVIPAPPAS
jgi:hypothetical protein